MKFKFKLDTRWEVKKLIQTNKKKVDLNLSYYFLKQNLIISNKYLWIHIKIIYNKFGMHQSGLYLNT